MKEADRDVADCREFSFKLPDLGEGIVESEVSAWHVSVGDHVAEDEPLADVQTDKAIVEVTAPVAGRIVALGCGPGEVLAVGSELVRFELEGDATPASSAMPSPAPAPGKRGSAPSAKPASDPVYQQVLASPSLRKRAREASINLADVPGSGPRGRISHQDFDAFIAAGGSLAVPPAASPLGELREGVRELKLSGMRRVIARKMQASKRNIPHYSYVEEVDVTELEALRMHLNAQRDDAQSKLTLLPFIMLALVRVVPGFSHCNARFDDAQEVLTEFDAVHLGVATMTDAGLLVPVVKHCEKLDIWQAAAELGRVTSLARSGKAPRDVLGGATITVSSLGAIGGVATTPIINAPETAIIGVNKMQQRPVVRNGEIVVRTMMNLSASFDHRIVDGYDGAQLVQSLRTRLENPGAIFV
ncbi:MAG: dihydrolipoamide acetyltransferase family protein [Pseudomonadota bacterium]